MNKLLKFFSVCIILAFATNANASIVNPGFEDGLTGWNIAEVGNFGVDTEAAVGSFTTGGRSLKIWSLSSCANEGCGSFTFSVGDYMSVSQSIDMALINSIVFNAKLGKYLWSTDVQSFIEVAVYIDSTEVWSSQTIGEYYDVSIDTSLVTGAHFLDIRMQAIGNGVDTQSDWFYVDNIRANYVPIPATVWLFGSGLIGLIGLARRKI